MANLASWGHTISVRLVLLVAVVAAPLMGLQFYDAVDAAHSARQEALDQSLQTARSVLARIDDHVRNVETLLVAVGSTVPARRDAVDQGHATLRKIKADLPTYFGSISVIELDGNMLYSAESPPPRPGTVNVADRGYFRDALATGRLAVGDPVLSRTSGKWIQVLARPIRDGAAGPISGVVSASTLLTRFQDIFADVNLPPGSVITVINLNGVVLARSVEPEKFVGTNQSAAASVRQVLHEREGAMELASTDGVTRLSGFTTSRLVPWLVYVGIPTDSALAPSRTHLLWGVLLTLLVAALAIGAASWVARGIAQPLRRLARDAATLAGGTLSHRTVVAAGGELGDLAASFNAMADDLERDRSRLRESEERFRLAASTGHVWDWNIVTNQASFFREFWRGLGYEEQHVEDQATLLESLMHPDDRPRWRQAIKDHISRRLPYDLDFRARAKSGEYRWFNTRGQARWDESGRATYMAGTTFDITERKQAENELIESERRYRALFENMTAGFVLFEVVQDDRGVPVDLLVIAANQGFATTTGLQLQDVIGKRLTRVLPGIEDDDADWIGTYGKVALTGEPRQFEQSSELLGVHYAVTAYQAAAKLCAVTFVDVTERKQAEIEVRRLHEELLRHANELEQRVVERTTELEAARIRAETADQVKSAFLATMSHELRTPLNSIIGFTGILLQKLPGALNAEQEKQLGIVRNASRHLLALINDVLDISKVEAGELHLDVAPFDLHALLERLGTAFAPQAGQRALDFRLDIGEGGAIVTSDERRVEQVLNNLLPNALKFTPRGNITLDCRRVDDGYEISVADTGVGIKPEDMDKLFRPFVQIETGLPGVREGTGLGLAISMHLAQAMGGRLTASSQRSQGSRFTFTLPTGGEA